MAAQREPFWRDSEHVWQHRFYDFNVWSERKRVEKLRYMHRNPVKRKPSSGSGAAFGVTIMDSVER